jgi:putative transposase
MVISEDLFDALMKDYKNPEDLFGETELLKQLTKQLLERTMKAEMTEHLGNEKNVPAKKKTNNSINGSYKKRVKGEFGNLDIAVSRNHDSNFEPIIPPKGQSRFTGFDDKIFALYARGMTTSETQIQLCLVHMVHHSLRYVTWKQRKEVASDLKAIYRPRLSETAEFNLGQFEDKWNTSHPTIGKSWRRNWKRVSTLPPPSLSAR